MILTPINYHKIQKQIGGLTMASCKGCLHKEACNYWLKKENSFLGEVDGFICEHFKDRTRFVELPCKVGATVYVKMQFGGYAEGKVRDYSYFISCGFCVVVTSEKFDKQPIPFSEFGKTIFLTPEAAEQALKESSDA